MTAKAGAVIVGAAETDTVGVLPDRSALQLHAEAALNAFAESGIGRDQIDGIAAAGISPITVAHYLGITPTWVDYTYVGGASFLLLVRHAAAAVSTGMANFVLVTHGESGKSRIGQVRQYVEPDSIPGQFEAPYGALGAPTRFPIGILRYMKEFGLTHEQLAMVPVIQRQWAHKNPRAMMRDLITVDDVFASRMISYPLHLLECCLVTDGGGALIVTSTENARRIDLKKPRVHLIGSGESCETPMVSMMEDFTTSKAFRVSSKKAFTESGIRHKEVDHLMIYDAFAHLPIYGLEDLGFVGRGEAGAFIAEGNTAPGGKLPLNTNGGGLSYTHTGMYGMFAIQESVRQLRGEAAYQVPDVKISMTQGVGGMFMSAGTLILATDEVAGGI